MNLHIFQTTPNLTTTLLQQALEKRGHNVTVRSSEYFETTNPKSLDTAHIDVAYYWGGAGTIGKLCLLDFLHSKRIPFVNRGLLLDAFLLNKIGQSYVVACAGIDTPKTIIKAQATFDEVAERLGTPFVMKAAIGSCGTQVFLIATHNEFDAARQAMKGKEVLYQKFITNSGDFRVHVIGGKAVCAYKRVPFEDNFKANVAQGGSMEKIADEKLLAQLYALAEKVTASFIGADIVGVDLMQDSQTGKLYFIEINYIPGIKQVQEVTGVDVAELMVDYFESVVTKKA